MLFEVRRGVNDFGVGNFFLQREGRRQGSVRPAQRRWTHKTRQISQSEMGYRGPLISSLFEFAASGINFSLVVVTLGLAAVLVRQEPVVEGERRPS